MMGDPEKWLEAMIVIVAVVTMVLLVRWMLVAGLEI